MKNKILFAILMLLMGTLHAQDQCEILRTKNLRLLPATTFNVNFQQPLNGCFAGYLPENESLQDGLYAFGIFRDDELVTPLPVIEAGRDLSSNPLQEMKILAVSFNDMDGDGRRDITVIGQRLIANGERIFVQVYWGCAANFVYSNKVNADINWDVANLPTVNIKAVQNYVRKRKFSAQCGYENR